MDLRFVIELLMALTVPLGVGGVMWHRISTGKSLTTRSIQFVAVITLVPTIALLAMEKVLDGSTVGTLIGGLTGYLLSSIGNNDKSSGDR